MWAGPLAGSVVGSLVGISAVFGSTSAVAHELEEVEVTGRRINLVGEASSASEGLVSQQEIALRPLLRTGEVLELVPGLVVTQHSGTGKANQYFLRGFNLDHGTDFATWVDDMPVNMRTHGHGQGYTDLNFLIPETVESLAYHKGAYYADVGDFSSAGSARIATAGAYERSLLEITAGEDEYYRLVGLGSVGVGAGTLGVALELNSYAGPWRDIDEDLEKLNLQLRYSLPVAGGEATIGFMAYDNQWNSADQIPRRAVRSGLIDELGSIDTSVGGESSRYSLNAGWRGDHLALSAYAIRYEMDLWSNFTYFLDDPEAGDQFEQVDERWVYGGRAEYTLDGTLAGRAQTNRFGAEFRYDDIDEVGLYRTAQRQRAGAIRSDAVEEGSVGLYWENRLQWNHHWRSVLGARYDYYDFEVDPRVAQNYYGVDLRGNGGGNDADQVSLKGSVIYTFNPQWEAYASIGQGLHSNDARGTTIEVDPIDGSAVPPVDPLVESLGYEVGVRGFWNERLNTSLALWSLELDSELLFVGDAGTTEASRESQRQGVELTAYYRISDHWTFDLEYAWTDAEFTDDAPEGDEIPGAIEQVWQAGISLDTGDGPFGSLRWRYFGERPLVEDGSVESDSSSLVNLRLGYRWEHWEVTLDALNLLDSDDHDIDYFYASRLPGEPAGGVEDVHYHVLEPRTLRAAISYQF
ncbi:TonB-dependent receptor [Mangrovimicrobium sediminis]|uniref:TonB-dependent receptor n=2 Tax=Mangrovimicrobium sediminis TaxID=2562682 RepID=A0A4Z0M7X6_9GAMM|nr:TonB-dependent receptor [Haliea sp. SAOS-164]